MGAVWKRPANFKGSKLSNMGRTDLTCHLYLKQRRGEHDGEGSHQLVLTLLQSLKVHRQLEISGRHTVGSVGSFAVFHLSPLWLF